MWFPVQLGAERGEHLTLWPAQLPTFESGGTGGEHLPHHLFALVQAERTGPLLFAVGEVMGRITRQNIKIPPHDPGQLGSVFPVLGNKFNDLLILLHTELALDGAKEDLCPVEDVRRKPSLLQILSQPAAHNLLASLDIVRLVGP